MVCKSPENKNKLIIDEDAAQVVQDIFKWKIEGLNQQKIADRLNMHGILSPIEHKKASGLKYTTSFKTKPKALWGAEAVNRILRNEAYLGVMEQGKKATPNYKVRQRKAKPKKEWVRVEGTHDPIISIEDFQLVSELLSKDLRAAPSKNAVYLFSGILYCDDCGEMMIHKTVTKKTGTKYHYYICSTYKKNSKGCTSHTINESELSNAVLLSIIHHINCIANIEEMLAFVENIPFKQDALKKLEAQITRRRDEIEQAQNRKLAMYEKLEDGKLSKADFDDYQRLYNNKINSAENALEKLLDEKRLILDNGASDSVWIEKFKTHKNVTELSRNLIVSLIECITVFETGKISITYKYGREYEGALNYLFQALESVGVNLNDFAESGYRLKDFPQLNNIARDLESGDIEGADFPERKDSEHTTTEETVGEGQVFS